MLSEGYNWSSKEFAWVFEPREGSSIIITVPHDRGFYPHDLFGFLEPREKGVKGRDSHVWPIAKDILLRVRVNAVRGLFPRHFIDYNRSSEGNYYPLFQKEAETAFDDVELRHIYDYYHGTVVRLLMKAIKTYGQDKCLLMDFHGFVEQPPDGEYDIILSAGNRTRVEKTLGKFLSERGYRVLSELPESRYGAGFTTLYYAESFGVNTVQVEIAKRFRVLEGKEIGQKLSLDMAEFLILNFDL